MIVNRFLLHFLEYSCASFKTFATVLNILALRNHDSGVVETTIPDTETTFDWLECF